MTYPMGINEASMAFGQIAGQAESLLSHIKAWGLDKISI